MKQNVLKGLFMEQDNRGCKWSYFINGVIWASGFFLVVLFFTTIALMFFKEPLSTFYDRHVVICDLNDKINQPYTKVISDLTNKNKIVAVSDIISELSSFYSVIITILGILLGLSGLFGYIHIRALTRDELEKNKQFLENEVNKHFEHYTQTVAFAEKVGAKVDDAMEGTQVDEINRKIARLENQIEQLQNFQHDINETVSIPES